VTTEKVTYISIEALIAKNKSVTFSQTHQEFFYANKEGHPVKQWGAVYPRLFRRDFAEEKKLIISVITPFDFLISTF